MLAVLVKIIHTVNGVFDLMTDRYRDDLPPWGKLTGEKTGEPPGWELRSGSGLYGRILVRPEQLECAAGEWTIIQRRSGVVVFEPAQEGLAVAAYHPSGLRSGGRIVIDEAKSFRLGLRHFASCWQVSDREKLALLRIGQHRVKRCGYKERVLDLELLAPDAVARDWLLLALVSCYTTIFLQPRLSAVAGGGG
jgi:hypothetical protein